MTPHLATLWEPTIRKLERERAFDEADRDALAALPLKIRSVRAGAYVVREGDHPTHCCVLLEGYAYRHKLTKEGARQIVSLHMAGDIVDLQQVLLRRADHNVQTLTTARIGTVPSERLKLLVRERPAVAEALWLDTLVDASIFREWVLNVGRRDSRSRIAHMLCEFGVRAAAAGLSELGHFTLPMTQEQLADATGMTPVHVNRTLQLLGAEGLIDRDRRKVTVLDWQRLQHVADFRPEYLHGERR